MALKGVVLLLFIYYCFCCQICSQGVFFCWLQNDRCELCFPIKWYRQFFLRFNFFKYVFKEGWIRYLRKSKKFQFPSQERLLDMIVHIRAHAIWTFNEHQMYHQTYLIATACFYLYISITCLLMFYLL